MVAIPTTAAWVAKSHMLQHRDQDSGVKVSTLSPHLRPTLALVDPELTHSCSASGHRGERHACLNARHRGLYRQDSGGIS